MSLQNVTISYGSFEAVKNVFMDIPQRQGHGTDRPVRLREIHCVAGIEPDE